MGFDIDSGAYVAMAEGEMAEVLKHFANRVLGPMIVGGLKSLGLSTDMAFLLLHVTATLVFVGAVAWLLKRFGKFGRFGRFGRFGGQVGEGCIFGWLGVLGADACQWIHAASLCRLRLAVHVILLAVVSW